MNTLSIHPWRTDVLDIWSNCLLALRSILKVVAAENIPSRGKRSHYFGTDEMVRFGLPPSSPTRSNSILPLPETQALRFKYEEAQLRERIEQCQKLWLQVVQNPETVEQAKQCYNECWALAKDKPNLADWLERLTNLQSFVISIHSSDADLRQQLSSAKSLGKQIGKQKNLIVAHIKDMHQQLHTLQAEQTTHAWKIDAAQTYIVVLNRRLIDCLDRKNELKGWVEVTRTQI